MSTDEVSDPFLVLVTGHAAAGKTTIAEKLAGNSMHSGSAATGYMRWSTRAGSLITRP